MTRGAPHPPAAAPDPQTDQSIDAELEFHRECTIAECMAAGLSWSDADAEARRRFGPERRYKRQLVRLDTQRQHAQKRRVVMHLFMASARTVLRDLRRSPGFALGVIAMLTLGLGVNAITFGLVDRLVLSGPTGLTDPGELRRVVVHRRNRSGAAVASTDLGYLDYRDLLRASNLAGAAGETPATLLYGSGDEAERIQGRLVTASYFPLLGVSPALGRFFTEEESARDGARLVVLSHGFWQRRFGGDAAVLGRVLPIGGHRYTVVGVTPSGFTGSAVTRVDAFLPLEAASDEQVEGPWRTSRNFIWIGAITRLADSATDATAADEATAHHLRAYAEVPNATLDRRIELVPLNAARGVTASGELGVAGLVGAVALLVLIIAVANAANLFFARALRRREATALRLALGGARWRLIAEQAGQGAMLALIGAGVALVVAWFGAPVVQRLLFPDVAWLGAPVDVRLLMLLAGVAVLGGGLAAALPMWQIGRHDTVTWLRSGTQRGAHPRSWTQTAMLVVQGALSVMLLIGAGLFAASLTAARAVDLGIDADRLLVMSIVRGGATLTPDFRERLRASVEKVPGIEGVTRVAGTLPFVSSWGESVTIPGVPERPRVDDGGPYIAAVEPGYFRVAGTAILDGRGFTDADRAGAPPVAIVNQTMARLYWPGERAIGKCLEIGSDNPPCSTVVGIAQNTRRQALVEGDSLLYYVPILQAPDDLRNGGQLLMRASSSDLDSVAAAGEAVRRATLEVNPALRYVAARSLDEVVSPQLRAWRLGADLFGAFGALALVVATIGLYSVVAFNIEGRRREMGLRSALGATAQSILGLVVRDGLKAAAGGVVVGLALAWVFAPVVADLLYGVPPRDARVFAWVAIVLVGAAMLASALPGIRAGRVDPSTALRDD